MRVRQNNCCCEQPNTILFKEQPHMNSPQHSLRIVPLIVGFLAIGCALPSAAQAQDRPDSTPQPHAKQTTTSDADARLSGDAETVARQFQAQGFSLVEAIRAAEDKCKGTAVSAMSEAGGADKQTPCVKVAVLDANRNLKCVTVGMDGKVIAMSDWKDGHVSSGAFASTKSISIVKLDEVIGKEVVNLEGENLGEIKDVALDPEAARIGYGVLSFGGVLGAGDKLFAVPWSVLKPHGADKYVINVPKDRLESAPGFAKSAWPNMLDVKWNETIHGYYQQPYYWDRERDAASSRSLSSERPAVYKASEVIGMKVHNRQAESIGEIEDIVVEPLRGDIRYAVVGVGGFLGIGERYIAVPWPALSYDASKKELILDVTKEQVEAAPGFDKDHWPDFANEKWGGDVHRYYNQQPYWSEDRSSNNRSNSNSRN
jgi:sporulation protein YlmC with PRC-barrel domain